MDGDYSCGENDFSCFDPMSDCVEAIVTEYSNCTGYLQEMGDGFCNDYNNNDVSRTRHFFMENVSIGRPIPEVGDA